MEISSYTFGPNDDSSTVLSLKANSRLIKDITACRDATIEFTSQKSARVTVGEEEYDLTFCDVKPTDAYCTSGTGQLDYLGQVLGRFQVTNSRSGVGITQNTDMSVEHVHRLGTDGGSKKREISLLEVTSGSGKVHFPTASSPVLKRSKPEPTLKSINASSVHKTHKSSALPVATPSSYAVAEAAPTIQLSSSMILLNHVPVDVSANDVSNTLFSGLSIASIYVCTRETKVEQLYTSNTSDVSPHAVVDLYVDFTSTSGAELALLRAGEELQYRSAQSAGSSSAKAATVRRSFAPHLQAVAQELSFWVKCVGLKLTTSTGSSGSNLLSANSTIIKHIVVLGGVLELVNSCSGAVSAANSASAADLSGTDVSLLSDPMALLKHWHPVVAQLLLPPGSREAYDRTGEQKVWVTKDTKYLFAHPAVDDILLPACLCDTDQGNSNHTVVASPAPVSAESSSSKGFIDDDGEGLYRADEDDQLLQFGDFVHEAEKAFRKYTAIWSALVLRADQSSTDTNKVAEKVSKVTVEVPQTPSALYSGSVAYGVENCYRKLVLSKLLFKEAWGLSTTNCVFK